MNFFIPLFLLSLFWFSRQIKSVLFWLYLWQLKEYHIGRFFDHFRTEKGKRLLLNWLSFLKLFFLLVFFIFPEFLPYPLVFVYFLESAQTFKNFFQRKLKFPVLTKKTAFLISVSLIFEIFFLFSIFFQGKFLFYLLIFDMLTPVIVSGIVLVSQPLTVFLRTKIIREAKKKREKFKDLIVIGITGSYGKTSTKEFLATILSEKYNVLKTKEHQNSEVGISQCILNDLKPEHEVFIVEMGAYNRGGIKLLCEITKPQVGILTGINEQHMATFGSLENIIKTKYELIESLPEMGFAVFNGDNKYCQQLYKDTHISKRICYTKFLASADEVVEGDYWAKEIKTSKESLSFKVFSQRWGDIAEFKVNLLGEHFAQNILMAAIVAKEIKGMSLDEIAQVCQKIKPEQSGMKLIKTKDGLNIVDSTYSANPEGVIAHLEYLKIWEGKKVIIMPCLIELGPASKEVHESIGEKIGQICDLAIIVTKDRFKEIKEGAIKSGMTEENIIYSENSKEIFERIKNLCHEGDVILLEGRIPSAIVESLK